MDVFAFTGTAGDKVIVRMQVTSGAPDPQLRIYNPDGTQLCTDFSFANLLEINCTLTASGSNMIFAYAGDGQTGSYNLHLQRSNNPASQTAIAYGQTLSGSLSVAPEMDVFAFTGTAGDKVIVRMQVTSGAPDPQLRIYNPDGTQLCTDFSFANLLEINCTLTASGSNTVFAYAGDGQTGGYTLSISKAPIFMDVPSTYWAWSFIERLYNSGVTGGCSASPLNYCPDSTVTRAQMAVFLLKGIHGSSYSPPAVGGSTGFADVPTSYWAAPWIKQLAAEGVTGGCGGGNFCPDSPVTRAQMAVFLLKSKHGVAYSPPAATGVFADVPLGYWADKWIEQLAAEGITGGCGGGNYCPDTPVTRAQMAVFLVKTFGLP